MHNIISDIGRAEFKAQRLVPSHHMPKVSSRYALSKLTGALVRGEIKHHLTFRKADCMDYRAYSAMFMNGMLNRGEEISSQLNIRSILPILDEEGSRLFAQREQVQALRPRMMARMKSLRRRGSRLW